MRIYQYEKRLDCRALGKEIKRRRKAQYGLIKGVKPALFAIIAGVGFHLLTPFRLGMVVVLSLSANRAFSGTGFARKTAFLREKSEENFSGRRKRQKPPGRA